MAKPPPQPAHVDPTAAAAIADLTVRVAEIESLATRRLPKIGDAVVFCFKVDGVTPRRPALIVNDNDTTDHLGVVDLVVEFLPSDGAASTMRLAVPRAGDMTCPENGRWVW